MQVHGFIVTTAEVAAYEGISIADEAMEKLAEAPRRATTWSARTEARSEASPRAAARGCLYVDSVVAD